MKELAVKFVLQQRVERLFLALFGCMLIAVSAQIRIPIHPVAITMQTVAVMFIGFRYDVRTAIMAVVLYITAGALGAPVFANFGSGISYIAGPSAGYIVGFLPSVIYLSSARKSGIIGNIVHGVIANLIIIISGFTYLASLIGLEAAFYGGVLPFILPGIAKTIVLVALLKMMQSNQK